MNDFNANSDIHINNSQIKLGGPNSGVKPDCDTSQSQSGSLRVIKFVNPIEAGGGDGQGTILERREDILIVDTGLDTIEVPINFVFDGHDAIPPLPQNLSFYDKAKVWVKDLGMFVGCVILFFTSLFSIFLSDDAAGTKNSAPETDESLQQILDQSTTILDMLYIIAIFPIMLGVYKVYLDLILARPQGSAGWLYILSGMMVVVIAEFSDVIFGF